MLLLRKLNAHGQNVGSVKYGYLNVDVEQQAHRLNPLFGHEATHVFRGHGLSARRQLGVLAFADRLKRSVCTHVRAVTRQTRYRLAQRNPILRRKLACDQKMSSESVSVVRTGSQTAK